MKKTTALLTLLCCVFLYTSQLFAQNAPSIKCKMSVEEILRAQPFDIDDAKAETAKNIAIDFFHEINLFYDKPYVALEKTNLDHYLILDGLVKKAKSIGMNYSMFAEDLKYIEKQRK